MTNPSTATDATQVASPASRPYASTSTWADGFGVWYAAVPGYLLDPRRAARNAIRRELVERHDMPAGHRVRVEPAPDHWLTTARKLRPVFREVVERRSPSAPSGQPRSLR